MFKSLIESLDMLSIETGFYINGDKRYKNYFGGLITLMTYLVALAAVIYFFLQFVNREESTIINDSEITNKVAINEFKRFPFMMRLSASGNLVIEENWRVWKIIGARWGTTANSTKQFTQTLKMEKCDLNKHFGEYRYLFENQTDLSTFICPDLKSIPEDSLYGLYGDSDPYSFYNFAIRPCVSELDGEGVCYSSTYIKGFLNQVFLDIRTIDFSVANYKSTPFNAVARGDRFTISQSIFRRLWMKYRSVKYNSDVGPIFSDIEENFFHQIDSFTSDVDMRDQKTNVTPYTFLWITLVNSNQRLIFNRKF